MRQFILGRVLGATHGCRAIGNDKLRHPQYVRRPLFPSVQSTRFDAAQQVARYGDRVSLHLLVLWRVSRLLVVQRGLNRIGAC
jgi:hypothetical protein